MTSVVCAALILASCGFHLRGSGGALLPQSLSTIRLVGASSNVNDPLTVAVRDAVTQAGTKIVEAGEVPTLVLTGETTDTQVASVRTTTGKASEYTLRYTASFRLDGSPSMPGQTVRLQRDYSFDPNQVLAKEREERELLRNMRQDAAQQIIRRLARGVASTK